MATLEDIAQELGLSKSTVSKALSGAKDISRKTQQAVVEKAVELGYSRMNYSTSAPRVAVFFIHMDYRRPEDFGYELLVGFRKAAEPAGYQVDVIALDQALQNRIPYDQYMMMENYCGGVFFGMSLLDPWIQQFEDCKTPTVLYDNHVSCNPHVTTIGVDITEGLEMAVKHLMSLGHTRIGYLSSALDAYVYRQRYHSFIRVMSRMNLSADDRIMGSAYHVNDCIARHLPRLLDNGCTAIICSHDILAHSVMFHCKELGLRVPNDISILGHDDLSLSRYTTPPMTTIRQDRSALGKSAFTALASHLNGVPLSVHLLHAELIIRETCGPV